MNVITVNIGSTLMGVSQVIVSSRLDEAQLESEKIILNQKLVKRMSQLGKKIKLD